MRNRRKRVLVSGFSPASRMRRSLRFSRECERFQVARSFAGMACRRCPVTEIAAAGICFTTPQGSALYLLRSPSCDMPNTWCFPGGAIEGRETPQECALRESREETGYIASGDLEHIGTSSIPGNGSGFATFRHRVGSQFIPELNAESAGFAWCPLSQPPLPLHPGVAA